MVGPYTVVGYASCLGKYDGKQYYAQAFGYGDDNASQEYTEESCGFEDGGAPLVGTAPVVQRPVNKPLVSPVYGHHAQSTYDNGSYGNDSGTPADEPENNTVKVNTPSSSSGSPCVASKYGNKSKANRAKSQRQTVQKVRSESPKQKI
jgi:hypothetical protein